MDRESREEEGVIVFIPRKNDETPSDPPKGFTWKPRFVTKGNPDELVRRGYRPSSYSLVKLPDAVLPEANENVDPSQLRFLNVDQHEEESVKKDSEKKDKVVVTKRQKTKPTPGFSFRGNYTADLDEPKEKD